MTTTTTPREIARRLALAGIILCFGVFLNVKASGPGGAVLGWFCTVAAALAVLKTTFAWGRLRGFPARGADGALAFANVVRNLVMAAIVACILLVAFAPLMMAAFRLAQ